MDDHQAEQNTYFRKGTISPSVAVDTLEVKVVWLVDMQWPIFLVVL